MNNFFLHFRLKTAQEELDLVTSQLKEKQDNLASITSKVHILYRKTVILDDIILLCV